MKIAVIGSRNLKVKNLGQYLPQGVTEIVSGGAKGIDTCAKKYALNNNIKLTEFLPDYDKYGRSAGLKIPFYTSKRGVNRLCPQINFINAKKLKNQSKYGIIKI